MKAPRGNAGLPSTEPARIGTPRSGVNRPSKYLFSFYSRQIPQSPEKPLGGGYGILWTGKETFRFDTFRHFSTLKKQSRRSTTPQTSGPPNSPRPRTSPPTALRPTALSGAPVREPAPGPTPVPPTSETATSSASRPSTRHAHRQPAERQRRHFPPDPSRPSAPCASIPGTRHHEAESMRSPPGRHWRC
jgi:hypothetical protein